MKKTYNTPQIDIVELEVSKNLLMVVSNTQVDGANALAPSFDDDELGGFFAE